MTIDVLVGDEMAPHVKTHYVVQATLGGSHCVAPGSTLSDPQWRSLTEGRRLSCNFGASASMALLFMLRCLHAALLLS
jgi:hypothetical protein